MKVKAKAPTFEAITYDGFNQDACDRFVGERSKVDGDALIYSSIVGDHRIDRGDTLIRIGDQVEGCPAAEFSARFEVIA